MLLSQQLRNRRKLIKLALSMGIAGCQSPSACPDLGDACATDQAQFNSPAVSVACECSAAAGMLGVGVDDTISDNVWAQEIENMGATVACVNEDVWINQTVQTMGPVELIHHVQLPSNACCGVWIQKLETTFGAHLNRAGPSPCGDWTLRYPWGTTHAH